MKKTASTTFIVKNFFHEFSKNHWFIAALLAAITAHTLYSFDTYVVSRMIDNLRLFLAGTGSKEDIYYYFTLLIGVGFGTWLFYRLSDAAMIRAQVQISKKIYAHIFTYIHHHSHQYFSDNFAGALFKRMNRYVRTFEELSDAINYRILPLLIHLIITVLFISFFSPIVGLIVICYVILFSTMSFFFVRWQHPLIDKHDRLDSELSGYVTDTIANHGTILSFGKFKSELALFQKKCNTSYDALKDAWKRGNVTSGFLGIVAFASYWVVTAFALHLAINGEIVFATFLIINTYNGVLTDKIWDISNIFKTVGKIIADAREGMEILTSEHGITDKEHAKKLIAEKGEIEFKNISFWYGKQKIFTELNLTIQPYEKVGIVGVSGSGKSTLTKLLMRLYDVQKWTICIDGQSLKDVTLESLHQSIALVPQDPVLFHRTLEENIRYAQPHISETNFKKYCAIARCDTFIEKLPEKYETLVGERGIKLSGWERQRVAIARALIAETPIIIFDEATSALDSESEQYIQEAMFEAIEGKTALVIAHRLSTIVHLERILVFDGGNIIEDGSHEELMKKWGIYAKLWTIQSGEFRE